MNNPKITVSKLAVIHKKSAFWFNCESPILFALNIRLRKNAPSHSYNTTEHNFHTCCVQLVCSGNVEVCDIKTLYNCTLLYMDKFVIDNVAATCNCHRQCRKLTYTYTVTQSDFSNYMISYVQNVYGINVTNEGWRQDYAGLEVR